MKVYIVIVYYSGGNEINGNEVKVFENFKDAEKYTWGLQGRYEVITSNIE